MFLTTGMFGNFGCWRRGIFEIKNGNSRWSCTVCIWARNLLCPVSSEVSPHHSQNWSGYWVLGFKSSVIPGGPKNVPNFRMALCNRVGEMNQQKKHVCNEQISSNMSMNFHLKRFHISRDTSEIVLHVIKQCLQTIRHLCRWLYAGYTRTSQ